VAGRGYQNIITIDLVGDPILTDDNIRYFKKTTKELYNFTLVRHDYSSASIRCRVACLNLPPYEGCDQALTEEDRKAEGSREWPPGARCQGKTHIKNDLCNLKKANAELQEQLKEQKKAHQGKPFLPSNTFT
jgi:hypothetical protein